MEEVDLSNLEPISINLGEEPKTNFGSGIELLMNDKKKSSEHATSIDVSELDKLEDDLNDLSSIKLDSNNFDPKPMSLKSEEKELSIKLDETDSKIGRETVESIGKNTTWDGFMKINEVPEHVSKPTTTMSERDKKRKKRSMLKSISDWQEKGYVKNDVRLDNSSSYEEIEDEYESALEDKRKRDSIKIQQNWLITFINTIEYGNAMFDPFGVSLDGWGEQVGEDIDSYDEIFGELYEKYKGGKMSPELSLLLRLGFSASVVHFSNRALSSAAPGFNDVIKQSPELMRMFTNATVDSMKNTSPGMAFAEELMNTKPNTNFGPPPAPAETRGQAPPQRPGQMHFTENPGSRPDLAVGRGMFKDQGVELNAQSKVNEQPKSFRPEMSGPNTSDINNILSGLKTKQEPQIQLEPQNNIVVDIHDKRDEDSMISVTSLTNLDGNTVPKKTKRRNRSDKKVVSMDI
tara:strand:- start:5 stop:1387 length:1383 start_codon:yes stop_codon:yes gene_type:complete